jgi:hypothetical protein
MTDANLCRLTGALKRLGYRPRIPVKWDEMTVENLRQWAKKKRMRTLTFRNPRVPYEEVDVVIEHPLDTAKLASARW